MIDSAGASFSLMYLPNGPSDVPAVTGPVVAVTPAFLATLGLPPTWMDTLPPGSTGAGVGTLYAVYQIGATPAAIASAPLPSNIPPNAPRPNIFIFNPATGYPAYPDVFPQTFPPNSAVYFPPSPQTYEVTGSDPISQPFSFSLPLTAPEMVVPGTISAVFTNATDASPQTFTDAGITAGSGSLVCVAAPRASGTVDYGSGACTVTSFGSLLPLILNWNLTVTYQTAAPGVYTPPTGDGAGI